MEYLAHFENCAIAVKMARLSATDHFYQQTLNEIRICSKIGYHRNICTMLGYVSTDDITCLLLELAQTSLFSALEQMNVEMAKNEPDIGNKNQYLFNIAMQIADGMV